MKTNQTPVQVTGKHTFSQEERDGKLSELLAAIQRKEELDAEKKQVMSGYKNKLDEQESNIKVISNLLNMGFEHRPFSCYLTKDFDEGKRLYHEVGTGKLISTEPLTAADYQTQLELDEKAIKANNEAADKLAEEPPVELSPEEIEAAERGPDYSVSPFDNPLEQQETNEPAVEPEVIDKTNKGGKKQTVKIEPAGSQSLNEHLSADDFDDPFSGIGSRDNALDLGQDDDDSDPFNFGDI